MDVYLKQKPKTFTTAPLPFMGQKRRFLKQFKSCLNGQFPDAKLFVDLFGGSGLLSHTIKRNHPEKRVIYNDYDHYSKRIENIAATNRLLAELRIIVEDRTKDVRLDEIAKKKILDVVLKYDQHSYVDYITLSSNLLFSMKYVLNYEDLTKQTFYNCIRSSDYSAESYLDGIEVISGDYFAVYSQYKDVPGVVFVVDPPYLSTECSVYDNYWKLKDYLNVLRVLNGTSYIYFTSNKSSIIELCEWIDQNKDFENPFKSSNKEEMINKVAINTVFTDIMMFKRAA
jgi:hypothetical protein